MSVDGSSKKNGVLALVFGILAMVAQVSVIIRIVFIIVARKNAARSVNTAGERMGKVGKLLANISFFLMFGWIIVAIILIVVAIVTGGIGTLISSIQ